MAMKEYTIFPKTLQMILCLIKDTLWVGVLALCRDTVSIFNSPSLIKFGLVYSLVAYQLLTGYLMPNFDSFLFVYRPNYKYNALLYFLSCSFLCIYNHLFSYDIKYSYLILIICSQLYSFMNIYLLLITLR